MVYRVVYSSDLHGNMFQYRALGRYALKTKADLLIIGGDLLQRGDGETPLPQIQRKFITELFYPFFERFRKKSPGTLVALIPGNDDASVNDDLLNKQKGLFLNMDGRRISLPCGFDLVGYSHLPITPFDIKYRERFDMIKPPTEEQKEYFENEKQGIREGIVSV
ncbi:MAG: metallophosphoesterase, partial [archaeon]